MKSIYTNPELQDCWAQGRQSALNGSIDVTFSINSFKSQEHSKAYKRGMHSVNFKFKQGIILVGPASSGKSILANAFGAMIGVDHFETVSGNNFIGEIEKVRDLTELIIVDEVPDDFEWINTIMKLEKVTLNKPVCYIPVIHPGFIFLCQTSPNIPLELGYYFSIHYLE